MEPKFDIEDFQFSLQFNQEYNVAYVNHLEVDESIRGQGYGSVIIETLKRVALQKDDIERVIVSMAGGKSAEEFLKSNGFEIIKRREYTEVAKEHIEGEYGVDAEYLEEWTSEDY